MTNMLEELITAQLRKAYVTELQVGGSDDPCASKFGGTPYFESGDNWPLCAGCQRPLTFLCQFDLRRCIDAGLPEGAFGLITLFYCWPCSPFETTAPGWKLRNYPEASNATYKAIEDPAANSPQPSGGGFLAKLFGGGKKEDSPRHCSVQLRSALSAPDWATFINPLVAAGTYDQLEEKWEDENNEDIIDAYYETMDIVTKRDNDEYNTQIGGYASWIQDDPELQCDVCKADLQLLLQVGSEQQANIMFGDAGQLYLMYCPQHPDFIKLEMQCF